MADNRNTKLWIKRVLGALLLLGLLALLVIAWLPDPIAVDIATVTRAGLRVTVEEDGHTRVKDRYVVSAPLLAKLERVELTAGDAVQPDQVLARLLPLDPPLLDERTRLQATAQAAAADAARRRARAEVARVKTAHEQARTEVSRLQTLRTRGSVTPHAVEQAEYQERELGNALASAEFAVRVADYELQLAQVALGRNTSPKGRLEQIEVRSPVAGQVLRVMQQSASVVQPASPLLEIGDLSALEIVADVLTSDAVHIRPGARAFIERWGGEEALAAHVRSVEPSAFPKLSSLGVEEQRVNVILDLDAPRARWQALGDGYRVEVRIVIWEGQDLLLVPASAVFRHGDAWAVFQVGDDGLARRVLFQAGRSNGEHVEVQRGLPQDARVILHPSDRVSDGVRVTRR